MNYLSVLRLEEDVPHNSFIFLPSPRSDEAQSHVRQQVRVVFPPGCRACVTYMHRDVTSGIAAAEIDAGLFKVPQFSRRLFDELLEAAVQLRRPNPDFSNSTHVYYYRRSSRGQTPIATGWHVGGDAARSRTN
jgi:hypothetical protein